MTDQPTPEQLAAAIPVAIELPHKQTVYRSCVITVERLPDGMALAITWNVTGEQMLFPMPDDVAQTVGRRLAAPRVFVPGVDAPTNGGTPH